MILLLQEYSSKLSQFSCIIERCMIQQLHSTNMGSRSLMRMAVVRILDLEPSTVHDSLTSVQRTLAFWHYFVIIVELIDARADRWIHIDSLYDLRMYVEVCFDELRNINYIKNISLPHLSYTSDPWTIVILRTSLTVIMTALCNRADHYIFALWFLLYIFYLFFLA